MPEGLVRIGELSRRTGVPVELLRAWERRYGLLEPARTPGGFRLYDDDDVVRVLTMRANLDSGLSAAEAARATLAGTAESSSTTLGESTEELAGALERFDEAAAQTAFDRLLSVATLDTLLGDVLIPYLHDLGARWERGEISVAQEHFASNVVRGRLLGLARGWDRGAGARALLACAEGERHDLPLLIFGLALRSHGWRISYLGADTPRSSVVLAADTLLPAVVVLSGTIPGAFDPLVPDLRELADRTPLYLGGAASSVELASAAGAAHLDGDILAAARTVAERHD
jgi:MerR family transcriptional regulator, light-induced transcriptional regulator